MQFFQKEIMNFYEIKATNTLFVGDKDTDRVTAEKAGCDFEFAINFF